MAAAATHGDLEAAAEPEEMAPATVAAEEMAPAPAQGDLEAADREMRQRRWHQHQHK